MNKFTENRHFYPLHLEVLPWQHQLTHEFENYLKTCTGSKCNKCGNFSLFALAV